MGNHLTNYHCHKLCWLNWKIPLSWTLISRQAFVFSVIEQENIMSSVAEERKDMLEAQE